MTIFIKEVRVAVSIEWDCIWQGCDYATYFHSREWAEIWNAYTKGKIRPDPRIIVFSDDKKALLPFSFHKIYKGLMRDYISSPGGTFGGWISLDELKVEHLVLIREYLRKRYRNLTWRINPYDKLVSKDEIKQAVYDETQAVDLSFGMDTVYKNWTKGHRSAERKARKSGVSVKPAHAIKDWHLYYQIYEDSIQRWGEKALSQYRKELFEEFFCRKSPYIKLWLAVYKDKIIAGALCFYAKRHVVYWHGAALERYFNLRPVNLLIYEIIKDACEKHYFWFDFNPSGGHEGVKAFKKSFGAKVFLCPVVNTENSVLYLLRKIKITTQKIFSI